MSSPGAPALLLDEMFSPAIAAQLRAPGHDVIAVAAEPTLRALSDAELYAWAGSNGRRLVTENAKDFRPLLQRANSSTGAALLLTSSRTFPRSRRSAGTLVVAIDSWLSQRDVRSRPLEDWLVPGKALGPQ